jgi:integral membrane protein
VHMRYHFCMNILQRFERARPFTESDAWLLFRIAAFGEAVGWTLLIAGILVQRYITPGNDTAVLIAGNIHGMIFFVYLVAALGLYPSLGWGRWRAIINLAASVPPYGTLVVEQWAAHTRKNAGFKSYRHFLLYNVLVTASQE